MFEIGVLVWCVYVCTCMVCCGVAMRWWVLLCGDVVYIVLCLCERCCVVLCCVVICCVMCSLLRVSVCCYGVLCFVVICWVVVLLWCFGM